MFNKGTGTNQMSIYKDVYLMCAENIAPSYRAMLQNIEDANINLIHDQEEVK